MVNYCNFLFYFVFIYWSILVLMRLGKGTIDFLLIRISSLILLMYFLFLTGFFLKSTPVDYFAWSSLMSNPLMKVATFLFLISFGVHAWLGTWAIGSDYLSPRFLGFASPKISFLGKPLNFIYRVICGLLILVVVLWSAIIIW